MWNKQTVSVDFYWNISLYLYIQSTEIKSQILLDRFGSVNDMAAAVAFLVSADASYITGEVLPVSGGMQSRLWNNYFLYSSPIEI